MWRRSVFFYAMGPRYLLSRVVAAGSSWDNTQFLDTRSPVYRDSPFESDRSLYARQ
jgi:hypothetical protein